MRRSRALGIGKKLYVGFASIVAILFGLFLVNSFSGWRERASRTDSAAALASVRTIEAVRLQIMLNRLYLDNFLLSGDPRDEEKVNKGTTELFDALKRVESQATSDQLRTALIQVESTEASWSDNFSSRCLQSGTRWIPATPPFPTCRSSTCRRIRLPGCQSLPPFWTRQPWKSPEPSTTRP